MTENASRDPRVIFVSRARANAEHAPSIVHALEADDFTCVVHGQDFT